MNGSRGRVTDRYSEEDLQNKATDVNSPFLKETVRIPESGQRDFQNTSSHRLSILTNIHKTSFLTHPMADKSIAVGYPP